MARIGEDDFMEDKDLNEIPNSSMEELRVKALIVGLRTLMGMERQIALNIPGSPLPSKKATPKMVRTYCLALIDEVTELLTEFNWKPWKKTFELDEDAVLKEMTDILAFTGCLLNLVSGQLDVSAQDLAEEFCRTTDENIKRANGKRKGYGVNEDNL